MMTQQETIAWCIGRLEGALGSTDQTLEHKDEAIQAVLERLKTVRTPF